MTACHRDPAISPGPDQPVAPRACPPLRRFCAGVDPPYPAPTGVIALRRGLLPPPVSESMLSVSLKLSSSGSLVHGVGSWVCHSDSPL